MTVPVVKLLLQQYPGLTVTFVSTPFMQPLFEGIERLHFYPADIKGQFNGVKGLYSLSKKLKKEIPFDALADLHDVIRTKLLRFFLISSVKKRPVAVIDKGRKEKEELTRPVNKKLRQLKTSFQRYADVFEKLGFSIQLNTAGGIVHAKADPKLLPYKKQGKLIGIAPFARHLAKMYPVEKMKQVVELLAQNGNTILLIGSRDESKFLESWEKDIAHVHSLAGKMDFASELNVISQLDVLVSMDSANMHFASLYGVPVVSIWGGTHPYLGFYGWGQQYDNALQLDLPCRPSSVFGNKDCPVHGKSGCMDGITPQMIVEKALG
jgi:ADP-heptose:LPS heptosyltransferase